MTFGWGSCDNYQRVRYPCRPRPVANPCHPVAYPCPPVQVYVVYPPSAVPSRGNLNSNPNPNPSSVVEVGDIKGFDKSPLNVGNIKGSGQSKVGDIKGFDKSPLNIANS